MKRLKNPVLSVDGIIIEKGKVLMIKRKIEPFKGYWVLPGGHVEYGETVENAIKREIKEELGVSAKIEKLIGVFSNPKRDPRYHSISIAYLLKKEKGGKITLNFEASEFKFFPLNNLPKNIGFDHREMIKRLKSLVKCK